MHTVDGKKGDKVFIRHQATPIFSFAPNEAYGNIVQCLLLLVIAYDKVKTLTHIVDPEMFISLEYVLKFTSTDHNCL